jgi:predicted small lipoprotein YifL
MVLVMSEPNDYVGCPTKGAYYVPPQGEANETAPADSEEAATKKPSNKSRFANSFVVKGVSPPPDANKTHYDPSQSI